MREERSKTNIVLIGMAGSGKSSVGSVLAPLLDLAFVDVDRLIEEDQQLPLQQSLNDLGVQGFRALEEKIILAMDYHDHVIATGGSAIYSRAGMEHLQHSGVLIFLDVPLPILKKRVGDFSSRGLVKTGSQSFEQVFAERLPLYRRHADLVVECGEQSVMAICESIRTRLADSFYHF
ncbi:MAG: shikimate kinase [Thermodesulfobacteriota bacterium]